MVSLFARMRHRPSPSRSPSRSPWPRAGRYPQAPTAARRIRHRAPREDGRSREVGLDPTKLDEIAKQAEQGKSKCLVVVRDGKLAGEWYFRGTGPDTSQDVFSVTKSISSTLVGIAQDDGDLRIGDRASKWISEWKGTPSKAVTVRDLLSNDSGREWSAAIDYVQFLRAKNRTAFAVGLPQAERPGTVWAYNNSAIQTLQPVVQQASGSDVTAFAERRVFGPLAMTHTEMTTDTAGNAQMFEGLRSTCRDLARFGVLFLNRGRWGNSRSCRARGSGGDRSILDEAERGLRIPVVAESQGCARRPLGRDSLQAAATHDHARSAVPGARRHVLGARSAPVIQVDPGSRPSSSGSVPPRRGRSHRRSGRHRRAGWSPRPSPGAVSRRVR